jgi:dihydrofolate synthase/folylpolyglutamate synthase
MEYFEKTSPQAGEKKIRYLLDGAHNPSGVKNLADTLERKFSGNRVIGVWGSMIDKDLTATLNTILPHFDEVIITRPEGERSARPEQIFALLTPEQQAGARCIAGVEEALRAAEEMAEERDLIVVGGSLYLIGAIRYLLKGDVAR